MGFLVNAYTYVSDIFISNCNCQFILLSALHSPENEKFSTVYLSKVRKVMPCRNVQPTSHLEC
uniref:Transcription factor bHLH104 n=1 Tax=Rhizophora mucronata TaxID=61149 RepID=A0A2P2KFR6_RHIMU